MPSRGTPKARKMNADMALFTYGMNKKDEKVYNNVCEYCGKPFTFQMKDVKDRTLKCPNCKVDMFFFAYDYIK